MDKKNNNKFWLATYFCARQTSLLVLSQLALSYVERVEGSAA